MHWRLVDTFRKCRAGHGAARFGRESDQNSTWEFQRPREHQMGPLFAHFIGVDGKKMICVCFVLFSFYFDYLLAFISQACPKVEVTEKKQHRQRRRFITPPCHVTHESTRTCRTSQEKRTAMETKVSTPFSISFNSVPFSVYSSFQCNLSNHIPSPQPA